MTAVITLILGFIFVETVVDWVVALLGMVVSLPASRGTKHLTEEEQEADIQKFREELIYGEDVAFIHFFPKISIQIG